MYRLIYLRAIYERGVWELTEAQIALRPLRGEADTVTSIRDGRLVFPQVEPARSAVGEEDLVSCDRGRVTFVK